MPFYFAGKLAAGGQVAHLYDKAAYQPLIEDLRSTGERMNPIDAHYFIRPAFEAYYYIPFGLFSYRTAVALQVAVNLALLGALIWKLPVWFPLPGWFRICLLCFLPFLWSVGIGQDTLPITLIAAWALYRARTGDPMLPGILLGLCAYKPHLIWAMPIALLAAGKRRMPLATIATGGALAAISLALVGPAGVRQYLKLLEAPSTDFMPHIMGNVRALGLQYGPAAALAAAVLTLAGFALILWRGILVEKFSAAILTALLLSPHTYWQDYSLAAIVAAVGVYRILPFFVLLPWPHFYPRKDMLPWIFLSLLWFAAHTQRHKVA